VEHEQGFQVLLSYLLGMKAHGIGWAFVIHLESVSGSLQIIFRFANPFSDDGDYLHDLWHTAPSPPW
jgi:hypothetical protein